MAVISYALWQELFGGDPRALGAAIRLANTPLTVIGIARSRFDYPHQTSVWTPTVFDRALRDEFLRMEEAACAKRLVKRHLSAALVVRWPGETLTDLDLPGDYERVKALTAARGSPDAP